MLLFQPPPPTRYDLNFSVAGIPVRVHPLFWLIALLLGSSAGVLNALLWVLAIFVSILVHELGHAFAMRRYGMPSYIILYWGGGLTVPQPVKWGFNWAGVSPSPNQEIFISLAGPFSGFLMAGLILGAVAATGGSVGFEMLLGFIPIPVAVLPWGGFIANVLVSSLLWVNVFWGLINLMPVYPLDGGNVARHALLKADPLDGVRKSLWLSVITGGILAVVGLLFLGSIFMALMFGFLAFQSYQSLSGRY
ncbi:MAG: site-2 protease family protein [Chloroflexota bacterium]